MDELFKQVRRARWRIELQRFLTALGWCCFATLLVALALTVVGKYYPLHVADWVWPVAAVGVGILAALVWIIARRHQPLFAAIEIDRRFGLKERVSSTLALRPEERDSPAGQALVQDAQRRVERLEIGEKFGVELPRPALLPLVPGVLVLLAALFLQPRAIENPADAKSDPPNVQQQVKRSTDDLHRRLADRRKEAEKANLQDAERLFKKLEESTQDLTSEKANRKDTLVKLNDLTRDLQARRKQVEGVEEAKRQLESLKSSPRGPAEKFANELSKGNFQQAAAELEKLKEQLTKGDLDQEQKDALAKQLEQMKEKLEKMEEARQAAQADLKKRMEQARQQGNQGEADKLQQQLDKLLQQTDAMKPLGDMANQLGQCAKCLRNGQLQDAQNALRGMKSELDKLKQSGDELEMLDAAMDQLAMAREQLQPCPNCGGKGCELCKGKGFCQGEGDEDGPPGDGLGRGRGFGERPETKTDTNVYDSQVRQRLGQGVADMAGLVDGPNIKGNVQQQIQAQAESTKQGQTDPLTDRRMPRKHREHAQEYFDRFREGK